MIRLICEEDGAEIVEFGLVLLPLSGFLFLIVSVCWVIFARATLQYAVTAGVRFASTHRSTASITAVVQRTSLGFITDPNDQIHVSYFNPANPKQPANNARGNVVQIIVSIPSMSPLAPILGGTDGSQISVSAADVME
jgi:Flp pilus assembly protein TadG